MSKFEYEHFFKNIANLTAQAVSDINQSNIQFNYTPVKEDYLNFGIEHLSSDFSTHWNDKLYDNKFSNDPLTKTNLLKEQKFIDPDHIYPFSDILFSKDYFHKKNFACDSFFHESINNNLESNISFPQNLTPNTYSLIDQLTLNNCSPQINQLSRLLISNNQLYEDNSSRSYSSSDIFFDNRYTADRSYIKPGSTEEFVYDPSSSIQKYENEEADRFIFLCLNSLLLSFNQELKESFESKEISVSSVEDVDTTNRSDPPDKLTANLIKKIEMWEENDTHLLGKYLSKHQNAKDFIFNEEDQLVTSNRSVNSFGNFCNKNNKTCDGNIIKDVINHSKRKNKKKFHGNIIKDVSIQSKKKNKKIKIINSNNNFQGEQMLSNLPNNKNYIKLQNLMQSEISSTLNSSKFKISSTLNTSNGEMSSKFNTSNGKSNFSKINSWLKKVRATFNLGYFSKNPSKDISMQDEETNFSEDKNVTKSNSLFNQDLTRTENFLSNKNESTIRTCSEKGKILSDISLKENICAVMNNTCEENKPKYTDQINEHVCEEKKLTYIDQINEKLCEDNKLTYQNQFNDYVREDKKLAFPNQINEYVREDKKLTFPDQIKEHVHEDNKLTLRDQVNLNFYGDNKLTLIDKVNEIFSETSKPMHIDQVNENLCGNMKFTSIDEINKICCKKNQLTYIDQDEINFSFLLKADQKIYFGNYSLLATLHSGFTKKVLLAKKEEVINTDEYNNFFCAIKIFKKPLTGRRHFVSVSREVQMLKKISHRPSPFLIRLIDSFQTKRHLMLALNYIEAGNLKGQMTDGHSLPESHATFYTACLVLALKHLHTLGIAYGYMELDNVLLDRCGYPVLTNFSKSDSISNCIGLKHSNESAICNDFRQLGILLYRMLTGKKYESCDKQKDFSHISYRAFSLLSEMDRHNNPQYLCSFNSCHIVISIEKHPFFQFLDWKSLRKREFPAPIFLRNFHVNAEIPLDTWTKIINSRKVSVLEEEDKLFRHEVCSARFTSVKSIPLFQIIDCLSIASS